MASNTILKLILSLTLALALCSNSYAGEGNTQSKEDIVHMYKMIAIYGKYAIDQGDAEFNLGLLYSNGEGVKQDYTEAAKWFKKSAERGNAAAQRHLGNFYHSGQGIKQDYSEAAKWYKKSAEQGNLDAQYNIGIMYDDGQGVKQDYTEAAKWYKKAAEQGHVDAQYNIGIMYDDGQGVKQDYTEAAKWYKKAAEQGDADAQKNLLNLNDSIKAQKAAAEEKEKTNLSSSTALASYAVDLDFYKMKSSGSGNHCFIDVNVTNNSNKNIKIMSIKIETYGADNDLINSGSLNIGALVKNKSKSVNVILGGNCKTLDTKSVKLKPGPCMIGDYSDYICDLDTTISWSALNAKGFKKGVTEKPGPDACFKVTGITKGMGEAVSTKYGVSVSSIRLFKTNTYIESAMFDCGFVLDTSKGIKKCNGDVIKSNGEYLAHSLGCY